MPRPGEHERWTEAMLLALEADEHDFQEFKSSPFVVQEGRIVSGFRDALSRQMSAFANGAGGLLFIGLEDDGGIDGGVPVDLRGGGTRAWLEDVIPNLVDPPLTRFNVYEVTADGPGSAIDEGHAVYVIEVFGSEDAPHQSSDKRYYLRIAGKSRPMGHVHIQDVLRRTQHPLVQISRVDPYGETVHSEDDPRGPKAVLSFQSFLANTGRPMARHVGVELILPRPLVNGEVRARMMESGTDIRLTQRPGELVFFHYHPLPLFPGQEIFFQRFWVVVHAANLERFTSGLGVMRWRVYADDATFEEGEVDLSRFAQVRRAVDWVQEQTGQGPVRNRTKNDRRRRKRRRDRQQARKEKARQGKKPSESPGTPAKRRRKPARKQTPPPEQTSLDLNSPSSE
ncbi:MAG: helix-turn-helix domain-containing protein [Bradymonadia bacterium]